MKKILIATIVSLFALNSYAEAEKKKVCHVDEKTKRKFYRDTWANNDPDRAKNLYIKTFTTYYNTPNGRAEHMLNNARTRAKRKGIQITITKEWIKEKLEIGKCEITGIPFVLSSNGGKGHRPPARRLPRATT